MSTETPKPPQTKLQSFLRRLLSFVVLWTVILGALFSGNKFIADYVFLLVMMALAGLGLKEFYDLVRKKELVCFTGWGIFAGLLLMCSTFLYLAGHFGFEVKPSRANDFETTFLILFVLGICLRQFFSRSNV